MAKAKTKTIAIRVSEETYKKIANIIEETREYASTPDFVLCAIREYIGFLEMVIEEIMIELDDNEGPIDKKEVFEVTMFAINETTSKLKKEGGDPRVIMIRCPEGLLHKANELNQLAIKHRSLQDFVRSSIAHYFIIRKRNSIQKVKSLMEEVSEREGTIEEQKEAVLKIIERLRSRTK